MAVFGERAGVKNGAKVGIEKGSLIDKAGTAIGDTASTIKEKITPSFDGL